MASRDTDLADLQSAYHDQSGLEEFRLEMLHAVIPGVAGLAIAYDLWLGAVPNQLPAQPWPLDLGLIAVAVASALLLRYGVTPAGLVLNAGLALSILVAAYLHPGYPILGGLALLVVLVAALHGWQSGFVSALLFTASIIALQGSPAFHLSSAVGDLYTLSIGLDSFQSQHTTDWTALMAASLMVASPMVVLFFFAQRTFVEGISFTGLHG